MAIADILINNHYLNNSGTDEESGNTMTPSGAVYSTTAKLGSHSMFFDGVNDITSQNASTNLDETSEFAFVCWFKPDTVQEAYADIMGIRVATSSPSDTSQGIGLTMIRYNSTAATLQYFVKNTAGASRSLMTSNGYKDDLWHLLIVGRDSSNQLRINIDNGTEDLTGGIVAGSWWENGDFFKIGAFHSGGFRFKGYIDNVLTLSAWPSSAEIAEIWYGGAGQEFDGANLQIFRRRMEGY